LLRHDPKNLPYKVFPAPNGHRVIAGVLEVWIGFFLMIGFSIACNLPQIWALWFDVIRIQAEDILRNDFPASAEQVEEPRFMGNGVLLSGEQNLKVNFSGPTGRYYIVSGFSFRSTDALPSSAAVIVGDRTFPYQKSFHGRNITQIEELGGPVQINQGQTISIVSSPAPEKKDDGTSFSIPVVDYLEFIPEGSFAYRPRGWELGYRYVDFYRAINYDDMNLHFFLAPIPLWIFLHLFIVQLLFSRTLGGTIMGLHIQTAKTNERVGAWTAFLRTVCWFLVPFWGWTAIGEEHQWTDSVSSSRVVVFRE
jgi:hypothetical protein